MADKIVVLNAGRIEQVGSPLELYDHPANLFVAGFIGSPKMNFITGKARGGMERRDRRRQAGAHQRLRATAASGEASSRSPSMSAATRSSMSPSTASAISPCAPPASSTSSPAQPVFLTPELGQVHRFDKDGKSIQ